MDALERGIANVAGEFGVTESTPGFAVLVGTADDVLYEGTFGCSDLESGRAIDPTDNFIIASNTKQMCCTALLMLEERGLVDLDAPVGPYFPDFPEAVRVLTPLQMMGHTSGFADYFDTLFEAGKIEELRAYSRATTAEMLVFVRDNMGIEFPADSSWAYSNSTYLMLGDLVRQVDGRPFGRFVKEEILDPVGMVRSFAADDYDHREPWLVNGYSRGKDGSFVLEPYDMLQVGFADGDVSSNVRDMLTWQRWLFDGQGPELLSASTKARLFQDRVLADGQRSGYGLGLFLGIEGSACTGPEHPARLLPDHPVIWHTGGATGFLSYAGRFTEEGISIIVLTNDDGIEGEDVARKVAPLVLGPKEEE